MCVTRMDSRRIETCSLFAPAGSSIVIHGIAAYASGAAAEEVIIHDSDGLVWRGHVEPGGSACLSGPSPALVRGVGFHMKATLSDPEPTPPVFDPDEMMVITMDAPRFALSDHEFKRQRHEPTTRVAMAGNPARAWAENFEQRVEPRTYDDTAYAPGGVPRDPDPRAYDHVAAYVERRLREYIPELRTVVRFDVEVYRDAARDVTTYTALAAGRPLCAFDVSGRVEAMMDTRTPQADIAVQGLRARLVEIMRTRGGR
jgi:hypothetical protein